MFIAAMICATLTYCVSCKTRPPSVPFTNCSPGSSRRAGRSLGEGRRGCRRPSRAAPIGRRGHVEPSPCAAERALDHRRSHEGRECHGQRRGLGSCNDHRDGWLAANERPRVAWCRCGGELERGFLLPHRREHLITGVDLGRVHVHPSSLATHRLDPLHALKARACAAARDTGPGERLTRCQPG